MKYLEEIQLLVVTYAPKVLGAILTLIIGFWLAGKLAGLLKKILLKRNIEIGLTSFLTNFANAVFKILVLLSAATMFGLNVTSFVAIFSAVAFAIGMALQGNLSHMAAGVMILIFKPFKVGDFIVTGAHSGTVREVQIFNTILTTLDNRVVIIPNGVITSGAIENLSMNSTRKVPMTFGIGYPDDIDKAREVIKRVIDECPHIDHNQPADILVSELGDSSVNFAVRPWCKTEDYWNVHFYMHENIKKEFDKAGVGIPFPQMDVHVNHLDK